MKCEICGRKMEELKPLPWEECKIRMWICWKCRTIKYGD